MFRMHGSKQSRAVCKARILRSCSHKSIESAIRKADFLIDALPDDLEVKLELFTLFDKFAKPNAIFITTGSIPIDDLAAITFCPDRCIAVRLTAAPNDHESTVELSPRPTDLFAHADNL